MNEAAPNQATQAHQPEAPKNETSLPAPAAPGRSKRVFSLALALCLALGGGAYWYKTYGPGAKAAAPNQARKLPVAVAEAKTQDVEVFLTGLGTVSPLNSVTIKSRVDGQLMQVLFREGQQVKAGDLLLVIDPRPFQVQLAQAEGQLKRDMALLENARLDLRRYNDLIAQGAIARQQYDTQQSLVHQYEGAVATDKATADNARLQITYCRITAPTSGQVGMRLVDPGNMVRASDTAGLLVLNQISPINVSFTLPEDQLPRVLAKLRAGEKLRVDAYDREQVKKLAQGELASLDNQIDTTTGTVRLKAVFANTGPELYPNQFVNAKLLLEVMKDAVVIPASAVQRGQQGAYVYVLSAEGTVALRQVSVGEAANGMSAVLSGLTPGEKVVVDGADRLRDGAAVEVKERGAKPADAAAAAQNATSQNATSPNAISPAETAATTSAATNATMQSPAPPAPSKAESKPEAKPNAKPEAKNEARHEAPKASAGKPDAPRQGSGGIAKPEAVKALTGQPTAQSVGQSAGEKPQPEKTARPKPDRTLVYKPEAPGQTNSQTSATTGATTTATTSATTSVTSDAAASAKP
ncbi:MAG TPA: MdtA/MuxA family multidrug efflux RND transporter periplasmic adaptor subunit [Humidesulfovibrio sp.]|uniref:MdtA/MuxA family multidrug efflux RND transporter periplasmic adaptor subunit n=1 Tax=Humidesulfovibrio sp. TaxID=2910988 RepID=UPI002BB02A4D|nr:MdtA/MuxA family multidrug efflux RND transporter periplasmic adaptor subunit [Humidesulfovibrio sp.]HWR05134.1 MdtA/MuxA family multidrug efflux RND transporter periplasmic adaptor subunit [Humidesulfovibrio sp.]